MVQSMLGHILQDSTSETELELDNLAQSCNRHSPLLSLFFVHINQYRAGLSLELEFVPYQLSHCRS